MPSTICLIGGNNTKAAAAHRAAIEALRYEKSVSLCDYSGNVTGVEQDEKALIAFIAHEKIDYLLPTTPDAQQVLTTHPKLHTITLNGVFDQANTCPHCQGRGTETVLAYSTEDQRLLLSPALPAKHISASQNLNSPTPGIMAFAAALHHQYTPQGTWCFNTHPQASTGCCSKPQPVSLHHASLLRCLGMNIWALDVFEKVGRPVSVISQPIPGTLGGTAKTGMKLTVPLKRLYLDMDDTLYVHGRLNPYILQLVETCGKVGIPVTLITRHFQEPGITLANYGIRAQLFDQIHWITGGHPKSSYMEDGPGYLFIDDSYQERQEVRQNRNISVFPPDIAEILVPIR